MTENIKRTSKATMPPLSRFDGLATWAMLTDQQQTEIGAIALQLVVAWYGEDLYYDGLAKQLEPPQHRPFPGGVHVLSGYLTELVDDAIASCAPGSLKAGAVAIPLALGRVCRGCGCSDHDRCDVDHNGDYVRSDGDIRGSCSWVAEDLCSACARGDK